MSKIIDNIISGIVFISLLSMIVVIAIMLNQTWVQENSLPDIDIKYMENLTPNMTGKEKIELARTLCKLKYENLTGYWVAPFSSNIEISVIQCTRNLALKK